MSTSSNRHPEISVRGNAISRREFEPNTFPPTSHAVPQPNIQHARVLKDLEQTSKIGRRFSFDDNGGSYQGL